MVMDGSINRSQWKLNTGFAVCLLCSCFSLLEVYAEGTEQNRARAVPHVPASKNSHSSRVQTRRSVPLQFHLELVMGPAK
jgi:hypothetical protein